jgi:hypothetical protein
MQDLSSHTRLRYFANMLQAGKEPVKEFLRLASLDL